jgi:hypothetical protein
VALSALSDSWQSGEPTGSFFSGFLARRIAVPKARISPSSTAGSPSWVNPTWQRLTEVVSLHYNWDGRGSAPVPEATAMFALTMLYQTMPPTAAAPSIIPMGRGEIQLLWHNAICDLEVEVIRPNDVTAIYVDHVTEREEEWSMTAEFSRISNILASAFRN